LGLIWTNIWFFMISNRLKRNGIHTRLIILVVLFIVVWAFLDSLFFVYLRILFSFNFVFSVWRIFQFHNLFFIFLTQKWWVYEIRIVNNWSFNLCIFTFVFMTYLMMIKMIFGLNLIGDISILKLAIPVNGGRHDLVGR
jgi:hypothetical protein